MPTLHRAVDRVASSQRTSPKTALSYFAILAGIFGSFAVAGTVALAGQPDSVYIIAGIWLVFVLYLFASLGVVVFFLASDPTKLLLGQVDTKDLMRYREQQVTLGDSSLGERVETVDAVGRDVIEGTVTEPVAETKALPSDDTQGTT